jgi:hypothetical protein
MYRTSRAVFTVHGRLLSIVGQIVITDQDGSYRTVTRCNRNAFARNVL